MRVQVWGHEKNWSFWKWFCWGLVIYSALEACAFFVAWMVLKRAASELSGPYVAFIVPGAIMISLVWWLNTWRERGARLKPLARGWGLSMAFFGLTCLGALAYSGIKLHLIDPADAMVRFIITTLIVVVIGYFTGYRTALSRIAARPRID
jgi:drug/metabolite transporter (DMT)-like permease